MQPQQRNMKYKLITSISDREIKIHNFALISFECHFIFKSTIIELQN